MEAKIMNSKRNITYHEFLSISYPTRTRGIIVNVHEPLLFKTL